MPTSIAGARSLSRLVPGAVPDPGPERALTRADSEAERSRQCRPAWDRKAKVPRAPPATKSRARNLSVRRSRSRARQSQEDGGRPRIAGVPADEARRERDAKASWQTSEQMRQRAGREPEPTARAVEQGNRRQRERAARRPLRATATPETREAIAESASETRTELGGGSSIAVWGDRRTASRKGGRLGQGSGPGGGARKRPCGRSGRPRRRRRSEETSRPCRRTP